MTCDGEPVTTAQVITPFRFYISGATVFAPGVNLTDFSATYNSVFIPDQSGEVLFGIYVYGSKSCCAGLLSFSLDTLLTKSEKIPFEGEL